ncbi:MAG: glycosyltransferase family 2 protein [Alphaproteobacteria bacterium]|nr:glycosyltransferase family 2 protein [Alphaproteobacteria bacterium]
MDGKLHGVSFVVTAYNKEAFLEGTLKSVLDQEGDFEREFIVIENGSEDRSGEIADDLVGSLPNGRVIRLNPNQGPAIAQNTGVEAATMPAIKFLDGDDLLATDCILRMLPGLDLPGVGLVHGAGTLLEDLTADLNVDRAGKPPRFEVMEKPLTHSIRHSLAGASAILVDRDAYLACGGCDPTVFIQENSTIYRMAINNAFAFTDDVILFGPVTDHHDRHGGHLGENRVQMEHDRNAALYGLIRDFPDLPNAIKRMALKRASGRAWNWARRINKKSWGSDPVFWINLLAYLAWLPGYEKLLSMTLAPYRLSGKVRLPPGACGT